MNQAVIFSQRVIDTLKSLPTSEREIISSALASEFLLGVSPSEESLTPFQTILYTMIRTYVERDMKKLS